MVKGSTTLFLFSLLTEFMRRIQYFINPLLSSDLLFLSDQHSQGSYTQPYRTRNENIDFNYHSLYYDLSQTQYTYLLKGRAISVKPLHRP